MRPRSTIPSEAEAAPQIEDVDEGPIVGLVNALLGQAVTVRASDLHIEPCSTHIAIRMRIDGVLHDSSTVPLELLRPVVSRVKILAGLDISQNRLAEDGRFSITIDGRSVDVRVVTMPTAAGEAVILRLLDPVRDALGLPSLGLSPAESARLMPAFTASQGAVFIVGPTGSGKTSTIYAVLSEVNTRVQEHRLDREPGGVPARRHQADADQSPRRGDLPDRAPVGTSLRPRRRVHRRGPRYRDPRVSRPMPPSPVTSCCRPCTRPAAAAPMRLVEMGVEPYLVASALTLVVSQRLARKLCEYCAEPADDVTVEQLHELGAEDSPTERRDRASPGRVPGLPEYRLPRPAADLRDHAHYRRHQPPDPRTRISRQIEDLAVEEGMDTLLRGAIKRVVRGELSVEEMLRIIS